MSQRRTASNRSSPHSVPCSQPSRKHIEQNREIMRDAAGQYEDMPGSMKIANSIESEKDDAKRVSHTARSEPRDAMPSNRANQWPRDEDNEPALKQIDHRG